MNVSMRIITFHLMLVHIIWRSLNGESHRELYCSSGPSILGMHFGIIFHGRWCSTCGYLKTEEQEISVYVALSRDR